VCLTAGLFSVYVAWFLACAWLFQPHGWICFHPHTHIMFEGRSRLWTHLMHSSAGVLQQWQLSSAKFVTHIDCLHSAGSQLVQTFSSYFPVVHCAVAAHVA
jgi:hypothetical protein